MTARSASWPCTILSLVLIAVGMALLPSCEPPEAYRKAPPTPTPTPVAVPPPPAPFLA